MPGTRRATRDDAVIWRDIDVDGATMRVMEAGTGDPLLFLHGWGLTPRSYRDGIVRLTAAGVRVIAPALPGFGGSAGPPLRAVDLPTYAGRIARLLDVLAVEQPVFVAGHSFGGGVALQLATDRPDRVRSLTLINTVGGAPDRRRGVIDKSWLAWGLGTVGELDARGLVRSLPAMARDFLPNALRRPLTMALAARVALTASLAGQARDLVDRGLPVLFIWADSDRVIAPGALGEIVTDLPAEVVEGHHGWLLTDPEAFSSLLRNALVVHAMLERKQRGQSMVLPLGTSLADLIPIERRRASRVPRG